MPFAADGSFSLSYQFGTATRADSQFPNKVGVALDDIAASLNLPDVLTNNAVKTLAVQFGDTTLASAVIGSPTGGNKGTGKLNAVELYENNVRVQTTGALLAANNLSDLANAATARHNLGTIAQSQTFFLSDWFSSFPANPTRIIEKSPIALTIVSFTAKTDTGSVTAALEINGTPVTGGSLAVTTTQGTATPSAANVMAANDTLQIRFSSFSSPALMSWTLVYTRNLDLS